MPEVKSDSSREPASAVDLGEEVLRGRIEDLERDLAELYFRLLEARRRETGVDGKSPGPATLDLRLRLQPPEPEVPESSHNGADGEPAAAEDTARVKGRGSRRGAAEFIDKLRRAACLEADRSAVFPLGQVYCYWSKSFETPSSVPDSPRSVFGGYSATGQPLWPEMTTVFLARGDSRIDCLYRDPPTPVTLVQGARELLSDQLATWGRRSSIYRILGQVLAGYLVAPARDGRPRQAYAVTFQAVQHGGSDAPIFLNIIGNLSDGTPVREVLEEASDRLQDALIKTRRALAEVRVHDVPRRRRQRELSRRVLDQLRKLSRNLERIFRQRGRRTLHARDRQRTKQRPTSTAWADALAAKDDAVYRDVEENTWIVLGRKNRVHVFNDAGRHVTSVVYPGETVRHRTTRGKWVRPESSSLGAFRRAVETLARND